MARRDLPSPLWSLHCALDEFIEMSDGPVPSDLAIIVGVEMYAYMQRLYHTQKFSIRGYPVVPENQCQTKRILFLSMTDYVRLRREPEFWR